MQTSFTPPSFPLMTDFFDLLSLMTEVLGFIDNSSVAESLEIGMIEILSISSESDKVYINPYFSLRFILSKIFLRSYYSYRFLDAFLIFVSTFLSTPHLMPQFWVHNILIRKVKLVEIFFWSTNKYKAFIYSTVE